MKKILVVDDELINRKLIRSILRSKPDYKVLEASNGLEAKEIIEMNPDISLILLDIKMPVMNGIEFLKERLKNEKLRKIPVVILTTDDTKKREVYLLAVQGFLVKPLNPVTVLECVDKFTNK